MLTNNTNKTLIVVATNSIHSLRYLNGICQILTHTSFQQILFITNRAINNMQDFNKVAVRIINFSLYNLLAPWQIAKIIKHYPNSTIHIHQANSYAYHTILARKLSGYSYKTILTTWGSDILLLPKQNFFYKCMVKFCLTRCDIVTADSLYVARKIDQLCAKKKVQQLQIINFGVENFPINVDMSGKENLILSTRLHKNLYNIDKIIYAYAQLSPTLITGDWRLIIAADGPKMMQLKQLAEKLSLTDTQIIFTGMLNTSELAEYYKKAKIFVSIPDSDATSSSLLEAMSYGCYPLVSNVPANLEWIMDGVNGAICQDVDNLVTDLANAINFINTAPRFKEIPEFNYTVIKHKAVFSNNITRFMLLLTPMQS